VSPRLQRVGRWVASLLALAILAYLVWRAHPRALLDCLSSANWWLLAAAMAINFVQIGLKATRLRTLLLPVKRVRLAALYRYILLGYAGNNVLPLRGGEVVRLALLRQREAIPAGAFMGVFSAERVLDGASVVAVAAVVPLLAPLPPAARFGLGVLVAATLGGYIALLAIAARWGTMPADAGRLRRFIANLALGARALRRPALLASSLASSVGALVCEAAIVLLVMKGLALPLIPAAAPLIILFVNLALTAPNVPANLGAFEAGAVIALTVCGVSETPALAFALAYHAVHLVPVTLAGALAYATLPVHREEPPPLVSAPAAGREE